MSDYKLKKQNEEREEKLQIKKEIKKEKRKVNIEANKQSLHKAAEADAPNTKVRDKQVDTDGNEIVMEEKEEHENIVGEKSKPKYLRGEAFEAVESDENLNSEGKFEAESQLVTETENEAFFANLLGKFKRTQDKLNEDLIGHFCNTTVKHKRSHIKRRGRRSCHR